MGENESEGPETKGWWKKMCCVTGRLEKKVAVVTGASSGIGAAVATELARRGCVVIMACRDMEKATAQKQTILQEYGPDNREGLIKNIADTKIVPSLTPITDDLLVVEKLDLTSFKSVRDFAEKVSKSYPQLDFLVNNAGVMSQTYAETQDGMELHIGVNYLGHFLLTELLLSMLKKAPSARIVNVASGGHYLGKLCKSDLQLRDKEYGPYVAYNQSKLACVMYAYDLSKRLEGTNIVAASVNPGFADTDIQRGMNNWRDKLFWGLTKPQMVTPWQAAQTIMFVLLSKNVTPGGYYEDCEPHMPDRTVQNEEERKWLRETSYKLVKLPAA